MAEYSGPILAVVRIQDGLRSIGVSALRASTRRSLRPSGAIVTISSLREHVEEVLLRIREHILDGDAAARLARKRRDTRVGDAARDDDVRPAARVAAAEGEPVPGHPPAPPHPDGSGLAVRAALICTHPHAGASLDPLDRDVELGAGADHDVLEPADVRDDVDGDLRQSDDGIADELARPVPRDLAAAVDVDDRCPVERPLVGLGPLARRIDGTVLEEQHGVLATGGHLRVHLALLLPGLLVVDEVWGEAEVDETHRSRLVPHSGRRRGSMRSSPTEPSALRRTT